MSAERCTREDELLEALERSYVGAELAEHIASCQACNELHTVAGALLDDRSHAMQEAPVPSAGTMWWRMRIRHGRDAEATARRSLLIGHAVTLTVAIALVITFFGADIAYAAREMFATVHVNISMRLVIAFAAWVVLVPIAGWVAVRQK